MRVLQTLAQSAVIAAMVLLYVFTLVWWAAA